jgi:hydroxymethylpyrimidine pyrophosphatase-like HAD family hydrolase
MTKESKMNKKILGVDFDGTLSTFDYPYSGKVRFIHKIIHAYIRRKHKQGWRIVIVTCREKERLGLVRLFMEYHNIPYDAINENYKPLIDTFGECRKISVDLYIDDKNIGLIGFLLRACK